MTLKKFKELKNLETTLQVKEYGNYIKNVFT